MKTLLIAIALGLAAAGASALAAEAAADMKAPAKWASTKKSMAKNGRFHYLHVVQEKLDCTDCHADESNDRMFLRSAEPPPEPLSAHVNRKECFECHQQGKKLVWYSTTSPKPQ